jgi:putative peptide zinc metalloprotease protein
VSDNLYSPSWYRVAELRPRLRQHLDIQRHRYRGQTWHILRDRSSGRSFRFAPSTYDVIGQLDGQRSIQQIWETVLSRYGDDAPGQDEVISLLGRLHSADLLQADLPPDTEELLRRHRNHQEKAWKQNYGNPLRIRFRLFDPDRLLVKLLPVVGPVFGRIGALLWLVAIAAAGVLAARHWPELAAHARERVLAPYNLVLIYFTYPLVKALHEFGHAFAARRWGAEVHEMGIMLLVLMPVPYVDASATAVFSRARQRATVAAAGIMVELLLAALALFLWLSLEPGLLRDIAFNVMLIGGVSTLLFNGNPLLRFDGYYILVDAVGIPNLAPRSNQYLGYLLQRHLFGIKTARSPVSAPGERSWFIGYGIAAGIYRFVLLFAIIAMIADHYLPAGVLLAVWAIANQIIVPLFKHLRRLLSQPQYRPKRSRTVAVSAGLSALVLLLLFVVPMPRYAYAQGVLWLPERANIRAGTDCFVERLLVAPGAQVQADQAVFDCSDPLLATEVDAMEARLTELRARRMSVRQSDLTQAEIIREEIDTVLADLERARERLDSLTIRSAVAGRIVIPRGEDLQGRFVRQGEALAYVLDGTPAKLRVVIPQTEISLVQSAELEVDVRLAEHLARTLTGQVLREVPAATDTLPSAALGTPGGGSFAIDPSDEHGQRLTEDAFQLDIQLPPEVEVTGWGGRAHVRFDAGTAPLAAQWYRHLRQMFLRRFNV